MNLFIKTITVLFGLVLAVVLILLILFHLNNVEKLSLDETARKLAPGRFITLTDGMTHYEISGPDTGKVVVLVHGFSVPYYIWDSTFNYLASQGFKVLRYDEFGRGFSDRPDKLYDAAFLRKQLRELLDTLNLKQVEALAGLSFGGPVTTDFISHYPSRVNKLILVDPVYPEAGAAIHEHSEKVQEFLMALNPEEMVAGQVTDLKYPAGFPGWADQYKVQMQYKGFRHALVSTRYNYAQPDSVRANYAKVNGLHKPILLVWGREDQTVLFRYADSVRKVMQVDFFPVDDAGHLPHMEKASVVNPKLVTFLKMIPTN